MEDRYAIRPDPRGYSIIDRLSGEIVQIAMTAQSGLSRADADHTAALLNGREREEASNAEPEARAVSPG